MKASIIQVSLLILVILTSCEKENYVESDFDTYVGRITYNEKNEYLWHEKRYYKNNLIVKIDCSPTYIWNYQYDKNNNIVKFDQGEGSYNLNQYDSKNRCIIVKRYISDTLSVVTHKSYSDTLLTKEIEFNKYGDSISTTNYYYNKQNQLDSIIGTWEKIYHYYTSDSHKIIKLQNNLKRFESNTFSQNKLISIYEETYFSDAGIKIQSLKDTKKYNEKGSLIQSVFEQFHYWGNSYRDCRYLYSTNGKIYKLEIYDINSKLEKYIEYIYEGETLVKEQLYDSTGNKTEHTIIEYSNKK